MWRDCGVKAGVRGGAGQYLGHGLPASVCSGYTASELVFHDTQVSCNSAAREDGNACGQMLTSTLLRRMVCLSQPGLSHACKSLYYLGILILSMDGPAFY